MTALPRIAEIANYDVEEALVWVPEHASYHIGDTMHGNDKRRGPLMREIQQAGNHPFLLQFYKRYAEPFGLKLQSDLFSGESELKGDTAGRMPPSTSTSLLHLDLPEQGQPDKLEQENTTIQKIFDFWRDKMKHPKAKLDSARRTKIKARLSDFEPRDLCLAIVGATKDDFLMGRDPKNIGKKYNDFKTIFRDAAQIERLIEISGQQRGADGRNFTQDREEALKNQAEMEAAIELERQHKLRKLRQSVNTEEITSDKSLTDAMKEAVI